MMKTIKVIAWCIQNVGFLYTPIWRKNMNENNVVTVRLDSKTNNLPEVVQQDN